MAKQEKRVCVWEDPEYHPDGKAWIVSIDTFGEDGVAEYSDTQSVHKEFQKAKEAGEALASEKGLILTIATND